MGIPWGTVDHAILSQNEPMKEPCRSVARDMTYPLPDIRSGKSLRTWIEADGTMSVMILGQRDA